MKQKQSLTVYLNHSEEREGAFFRSWDCSGRCPWSILPDAIVLHDPTQTFVIPMTSVKYYTLFKESV